MSLLVSMWNSSRPSHAPAHFSLFASHSSCKPAFCRAACLRLVAAQGLRPDRGDLSGGALGEGGGDVAAAMLPAATARVGGDDADRGRLLGLGVLQLKGDKG